MKLWLIENLNQTEKEERQNHAEIIFIGGFSHDLMIYLLTSDEL